jgi:ABC-type Fe3+ transport system substrate-binding protein
VPSSAATAPNATIHKIFVESPDYEGDMPRNARYNEDRHLTDDLSYEERSMFRRSTVVVVLFALVVGGIVGYNQLLQTQPAQAIPIAVDPLAEGWLRAAADAFNSGKPVVNNGTTRIQVQIESVTNDVDVWTGESGWTFEKHPTAWVLSSSATLDYLPANLNFEPLKPSLARTPLVWGGFQSRVNIITNDGQRPFEWDAVNEALAAGTWANLGSADVRGNVYLALNPPDNSMAGIAALLSGAANLAQTDTITDDVLDGVAFNTWIDNVKLSMPRLVGTPTQTMQAQGSASINFALLPESQWLVSLSDINKREPVVLAYPAYQFVLDFPMTIWDDTNTTDIQRQGARAFADFLMSDAGQTLAKQYGLRPSASEPTATDSLFASAATFGIALEPDYGLLIKTPARSEVDILLRAME